MKKLLAILAVVILVVLVLLWRELGASDPAPEAAKPAPPVQVAAAPKAAPATTPKAAVVEPPVETKPASDKMDPSSDEFFYQHDEVVIPIMMRQAVQCWEALSPTKRAEFHRNQSMVAKFKQRIRNGVVTIHDLEVERSSIGDAALEACFVQKLRGATWSNPRLPDWDQEDTIKLGPRTLKKYTRENIEADGPPQPKFD